MMLLKPHFSFAGWGHASVCEELVKGGADRDLKDKEGKTAADVAMACGQVNIANMLIRG